MTKSILVVDDQKEVLMVLGDMLAAIDHTYEVDCAYSASEALEKFKAKERDLIITDIMMPGASGFDLIRDIRAISPQTKILCMTGKAGFKNLTEADKIARSMRADDIIQKPFEFYNLAARVQKLLGVASKVVPS